MQMRRVRAGAAIGVLLFSAAAAVSCVRQRPAAENGKSSASSSETSELSRAEISAANTRLLIAYHTSDSERDKKRIKERLLSVNRGLMATVVNSYRPLFPHQIEELEQEAALGLVKAIEGFDHKRGCPFWSYAYPTVRGYVQHHIRDHLYKGVVSRKVYDAAWSLHTLLVEKGIHNPKERTVAELADTFEMDPKDVRVGLEGLFTLIQFRIDSLNAPVGAGDGGPALEVQDTLSSCPLSPLQQAVSDALVDMEEELRLVIDLTILQGFTSEQVASKLGISVITVARRKKKGLDFLRDYLEKAP